MESKNDINELIFKTEVDSEIKRNLWLPQGKRGGGKNQELGINIQTLLYI